MINKESLNKSDTSTNSTNAPLFWRKGSMYPYMLFLVLIAPFFIEVVLGTSRSMEPDSTDRVAIITLSIVISLIMTVTLAYFMTRISIRWRLARYLIIPPALLIFMASAPSIVTVGVFSFSLPIILMNAALRHTSALFASVQRIMSFLHLAELEQIQEHHIRIFIFTFGGILLIMLPLLSFSIWYAVIDASKFNENNITIETREQTK